jgi:hypothetical protein
MAPILDATLPRLPSLPAFLSFCIPGSRPPVAPAFRSGLVLAPRRGVNASRNLPTGEGDLLADLSASGRRLPVLTSGVDRVVATMLDWIGNVEERPAPSNSRSDFVPSGNAVA